MKVLVAQSCLTLCDPIVWAWNSPEKNTGVRCHSLFQGIFPTQGLNLGVLHCRQILYHLSYQGSHIKKNKGPRNKSKEGKDLYPENIRHWWNQLQTTQTNAEILCSWIGLILLEWPYYSRQSQIQCNLYQNTTGIFHKTTTNIPKICMETQKTPSSENNLEKEEIKNEIRTFSHIIYKNKFKLD